MLDKLKTLVMTTVCPHKPANGQGSAVVKTTQYDKALYAKDGIYKVTERAAYCVICGKVWKNIPDWKTFKPSPGNPPKNG